MEDLLEPVTFGCDVDDVLRLLPGVTVVDGPVVGPSNPRYAGQGRVVSREDVEGFIVQVASRVSARLWRFDRTPEVFRENVRVMARDLVANGAASYVQAAVFPGSTSPNDGSSYAAVLWARFQTDLDRVVATVDEIIDDGQTGEPAVGRVAWSAPAPFFSDEMRF